MFSAFYIIISQRVLLRKWRGEQIPVLGDYFKWRWRAHTHTFTQNHI
jgi:hypothetical protein